MSQHWLEKVINHLSEHYHLKVFNLIQAQSLVFIIPLINTVKDKTTKKYLFCIINVQYPVLFYTVLFHEDLLTYKEAVG